MVAQILVVEGHDYLRDAMQSWLKMKLPEYQIVEATSGEEAIATVQTEPVRLVMLDISLPGINGLETVTRIKAVAPATPVLVLTTFDDEIYRTYTMTNGVDAFLHKAKLLTELEPTLAALLSAEDSSDPKEIESFGDLK